MSSRTRPTESATSWKQIESFRRLSTDETRGDRHAMGLRADGGDDSGDAWAEPEAQIAGAAEYGQETGADCREHGAVRQCAHWRESARNDSQYAERQCQPVRASRFVPRGRGCVRATAVRPAA